MSIKVKGKAKYQNIEGGFWVIQAEDGQIYRPQMMPVQFQEEDAIVECRIEFLDSDFGFQMMGDLVRIVSFKTIGTD